jgi:hypothetical protein
MYSPAPLHVDSSGKMIASGLPTLHTGFTQNINGGLIDHGAVKTATSINQQSKHAIKAGVTMRGGSLIPIQHGYAVEGGTIKGVSATSNTSKLLTQLNNLRTGAVYDGLGSTTPSKVSGGRKRRRKTNGKRISNRNTKRNTRKRSRNIRRRNSSKTRKH